MRRTFLRLVACSLAIGIPAAVESAQSEAAPSVAPPFHVALVEGSATLLRAGEVIALAPGEPLVDGDRLQSATGRLELRGPDGERVFLDQGSTFDVLQPPVFRLLTGAARVVLDAAARADGTPAVEIDTPHGTTALFEAGDYRVSVLRRSGGEETELIVRAGRGEMINAHGRVPVAGQQRVTASAFAAPSPPETLAANDLVDSFDRWVDQALGGTPPTPSAAYLPSGLASYSATLDAAGSWSYEPTYGNVWYPTVVASWQPYYYGFWRPLGYHGYTWVSHTPWAWATHHYGRWGFGGGGWFWIPGAAWASAWVSWGVGPGYVAWCPLGWGNRPVYPAPFARHYGRPVPYGGYGSRGHARVASSWTVLRADHFRAGLPASRHAVDWRSLEPTQHAAFVEQQAPPRVHMAVPRGSLSASARTPNAGPRSIGTRGVGPAPVAGRIDSAAPTSATGRVPGPGTSPAGRRPGWTPPVTRYGVPTAGRAVASDPGTSTRDTAGLATPRVRVPARAQGQPTDLGDRPAGFATTTAPDTTARGADRTTLARPTARPRWTPPATHYGVPPAGAAESPTPSPTLARPTARPRWTPPPTHYGIPPAGAVESPGTPPTLTRPRPEATPAAPRYAPPVVHRGSPAAAPRAPTVGAPTMRSVPARPVGGAPPAGAVGRPQAGSAGRAHGQAVPRGGTPHRSPGR